MNKAADPLPGAVSSGVEALIQRLREEGVDFVFNALGPFASSTFVTIADRCAGRSARTSWGETGGRAT